MSDLWRSFQELLPIGAILALAMILAISLWWRLEKSSRHRSARQIAIAFSIAWGVGVALVTLRPEPPMISATGVFMTRQVDLVPGRGLWDILFHSVSPRVFVEQAVGNLVLFMPLGLGVALLMTPSRPRIRIGLLAGAATSLVFEVLQWVLGSGRVSSVDDVILASLGTALGLGASQMILRLASRRIPTPQTLDAKA